MAGMPLLLGSSNPGKLREMHELLAGMPYRVLSPDSPDDAPLFTWREKFFALCRDFGPDSVGMMTGDASVNRDAPEETGTTFMENAILKARHYAEKSGLLAVADDSGLSVDALGGGPGLYSSRFGGEGATDDDRNRLLLERLKGLPPERRGARFTSAVAAARDGRVLFQAEESVEGRIVEAPRGPNGFGYDPVFFYEPFGKTFGEVSGAEKDRVSHRGKSFARLREFLRSLASPS